MVYIQSKSFNLRAEAMIHLVPTPEGLKLRKNAFLWLSRTPLSLEIKNNVWRISGAAKEALEDALADGWLDFKWSPGIPTEVATAEEFFEAMKAEQAAAQQEGGAA